jgi:hypothetical protein
VGCVCEDWEPGVARINGPVVLQQIRAGRSLPDNHFKPWAFCPWCGRRLELPTEPTHRRLYDGALVVARPAPHDPYYTLVRAVGRKTWMKFAPRIFQESFESLAPDTSESPSVSLVKSHEIRGRTKGDSRMTRDYLDFRKSRTTWGIGESPASQRRIVRSSRRRTSTAKRRADRPDASIAERRTSESFTAGEVVQCPVRFERDVNRLSCPVNDRHFRVGFDCSDLFGVKVDPVGGRNHLPLVGYKRDLKSHFPSPLGVGLHCPDEMEYRAIALCVKGCFC